MQQELNQGQIAEIIKLLQVAYPAFYEKAFQLEGGLKNIIEHFFHYFRRCDFTLLKEATHEYIGRTPYPTSTMPSNEIHKIYIELAKYGGHPWHRFSELDKEGLARECLAAGLTGAEIAESFGEEMLAKLGITGEEHK